VIDVEEVKHLLDLGALGGVVGVRGKREAENEAEEKGETLHGWHPG
jgi:hypothetical protein